MNDSRDKAVEAPSALAQALALFVHRSLTIRCDTSWSKCVIRNISLCDNIKIPVAWPTKAEHKQSP